MRSRESARTAVASASHAKRRSAFASGTNQALARDGRRQRNEFENETLFSSLIYLFYDITFALALCPPPVRCPLARLRDTLRTQYQLKFIAFGY